MSPSPRPSHVAHPGSARTGAPTSVSMSAPLLFTANDCLHWDMCLGSPVSLDFRERAPFALNDTISRIDVADG